MVEVKGLEAGRELDIRVAELITGQDRLSCRVDPCNRGGEPQFHWGYPVGHDFAPNYSTDIGAAVRVVEWLATRGFGVISLDPPEPDNPLNQGWSVALFRRGEFPHGETVNGSGDTAALAICRAACACGVEDGPSPA